MFDAEHLQTYIQNLRAALDSSGARQFYFPRDRARRKSANLRLAREIGSGLADYAPELVQDVIGSLYGILIVSKSLDTTGVAIDAREFVQELQQAVRREVQKVRT